MIPDEPHPLEGRLRRLPVPGAPAGWRDRVLFEAGRANARRPPWHSGHFLLAAMAAGFLSGNLLPSIIPAPRERTVAKVQPETLTVQSSPDRDPEVISLEDRLAWETRLRILTNGVETIPVPLPAVVAGGTFSMRELIQEVN